MNKKITTIELLKLIKEDKQPKTIQFALYIYHWNDDCGSYERNAKDKDISLFEDAERIFTLSGFADEEVEILEDEEEIDINDLEDLPLNYKEVSELSIDSTFIDFHNNTRAEINKIIKYLKQLDKKINKEEK